MPTSEALVQPWQAVLWDQLLDNYADCLASWWWPRATLGGPAA